MLNRTRVFLTSSLILTGLSVLAQRPADISKDFFIQGQRAIDAIQRMSGPYSASHKDANTDSLLVDSKKAVDEAKYVASTPRDKYVLHTLQMAVLSFEDQLSQDSGTPAWEKDVHRALQCETEAIYVLTPDQLSETGKSHARLGTCNKATDEWEAGITR